MRILDLDGAGRADPVRPAATARSGARAAAILAVDARSLALARIVLALCMLADLTSAAWDFSALFSDAGVLPRVALHGLWRSDVENSLYLMSGLWPVNAALLALHYVAVLCLLFGYRTRLAVLACLVFTISLQSRNFITNQASDDLMRVLLFGALFAPVGGRWSVDAALNLRRVPDQVLSIGAIAIQVQAMCVYTFGALLKFEGSTWLTSQAVGLALTDGTYGTALGRQFLAFPELLRIATYGVEFLELFMPVLIWFPIANARVRTVSLVLLLLMHLSFLALLNVGIFPFVSFASLMLFVTAAHWDALGRLWRPRTRCTRIYYDQDCGFCYKTCLILRSFCLPEGVQIAKAQPHPEAGPLLIRNDSWVVYDDAGHHYLHWDGVCFVLMQSPVFWLPGWIGQRAAVRPIGERLYRLIGRNRGALGRLTGRFLPYGSDDGRRSPVSEALAAGFLAMILVYNVAMLRGAGGLAPAWLHDFALASRLEQRWSMFAPDPRSVTAWAVLRGATLDGEVLDIFGGTRKAYSEASPSDGRVDYASSKWKKYYEALYQPGYASLRGFYVDWACRMANQGASGTGRVTQATLILFVEQPFIANPPPRTTQMLWNQACR
jgi:predicted DCC family thiol-disulfide oxidoreductase YuxK